MLGVIPFVHSFRCRPPPTPTGCVGRALFPSRHCDLQLLVLELAFPNVKYLEPDEGGQGREHVVAADPAQPRQWKAMLAKAGDGELPKHRNQADEYADQIEPYAAAAAAAAANNNNNNNNNNARSKPVHAHKVQPARARGGHAADPDADRQRHLTLLEQQTDNQPHRDHGNDHNRRNPRHSGVVKDVGDAGAGAMPGDAVGRGIADAALAVHEVVSLDL